MTTPELAKLLGVTDRTLQRYLLRGLTLPAEGETPEAWLKRAKKWRRDNRRPPGPKGVPKGGAQAKADLRFRIAKADLMEITLAQRRGELHSRAECEAMALQRLGDLRAAFSMMPDRLARRLYQAPSPETIKVQVEEELRRCIELLRNGDDGTGLDAGDAGRAPPPGTPDGQ